MNRTITHMLVAVVAAVVGLVAGYGLAPAPSPSCPPPTECSACPDPEAVITAGEDVRARLPARVPVPGAREAQPKDPADRARLEAKAALQAKLIEGMQAEKTGEPIPWRPDIPTAYHQDQFEHTVSQALDEIESPLELVQAECSEPPCISVLRGMAEGDRAKVEISKQLHDLAISQTWKDAYGEEFTLGEYNSVDCGDGRTEWVLMMAPSIDALESPEDETNLKLRAKGRTSRIVSGWACRPPEP